MLIGRVQMDDTNPHATTPLHVQFAPHLDERRRALQLSIEPAQTGLSTRSSARDGGGTGAIRLRPLHTRRTLVSLPRPPSHGATLLMAEKSAKKRNPRSMTLAAPIAQPVRSAR